MASGRPYSITHRQLRREFFELSKSDSLSNLAHDVKVKVDVVVGRQDGRGDFSSGEKMPKIRAGVALTDRTGTLWIDGALVFGVARVLDKHAAFASVQTRVTSGAGRQ